MPNRLSSETSPYLRQHADNPVDWWPWCEEAFVEAARRDVPAMLSSGYSACHWCHVMEKESFEDAEIAGVLNENFVPVKVDREERPDIDQVYQEAVQALIGQGGWPLTVFLTPDKEPVYGGTYFPPSSLYGRPGFRQVLEAVAEAWRERRQDLRETARGLRDVFSAHQGDKDVYGGQDFDPGGLVDKAARHIVARVDRCHGGFGHAPKFPNIGALMFMLRHGRLAKETEPVDLALSTLRAMARGGIHDQLGGGFHRYSTDERWAVPHFERWVPPSFRGGKPY